MHTDWFNLKVEKWQRDCMLKGHVCNGSVNLKYAGILVLLQWANYWITKVSLNFYFSLETTKLLKLLAVKS